MKFKTLATALLTASAFFCQIAWAQSATANMVAEPANFAEYNQMLQYEMMRPVISYCAVKAPATKKDLEAEFEQLKEKTRMAMAPLLAKIGTEELAKPVPPDAKATFKAMGDQMLDGVKKQDAKAYCPFLVGAMRKVTADSLRQTIETQFARYEQKAKDVKEAKEIQDPKTTPEK